MNNLIEMYLKDKEMAWAPTTLKSESHRLKAALPHLDGKAQTLWAALKDYAPYGRVTIWTRVTDFWQWAIDNGHIQGGNDYRAFRSKYERLFKNAYQKKTPELTFEEAYQRIQGIEDVRARQTATFLLLTGLRVSEPGTLQKDGTVLGKGGKARRANLPSWAPLDAECDYWRLRRELGGVGLKPHDLRKLFATRMVELGANEFQLCEAMGWSSIQTASSYVIAQGTKELVQMIHGGIKSAVEVPRGVPNGRPRGKR